MDNIRPDRRFWCRHAPRCVFCAARKPKEISMDPARIKTSNEAFGKSVGASSGAYRWEPDGGIIFSHFLAALDNAHDVRHRRAVATLSSSAALMSTVVFLRRFWRLVRQHESSSISRSQGGCGRCWLDGLLSDPLCEFKR